MDMSPDLKIYYCYLNYSCRQSLQTKDVANLHSRRKSNAGVHGKDDEHSNEDDVG